MGQIIAISLAVLLSACSTSQEDQDPRTMTCDVKCLDCESVHMQCSMKGKAYDTKSKELRPIATG